MPTLAHALSKGQIAALLREARRSNLATILQFRPSQLKLLGLTPDAARAIVEAPATRAVDRWARKTSRGRKRSTGSQVTQLEMLAVHFLLTDNCTVARAVTHAFNTLNRARHGEALPINSTDRKVVRKRVQAGLAATERARRAEAELARLVEAGLVPPA